MIFIDYSFFRPSKKWKVKSKKNLKQLSPFHLAGNFTDRDRKIDGRQYVWSEIKSQIILATVNKCWFSEATSDIAHLHIEHFRPKKKVVVLPLKLSCVEQRNAEERNCYWWLTFNYKNFRICGQIVNSYKGNYFPLRVGSAVCHSWNSSVKIEEPILIDPTISTEVDLLTFDINGVPIPSSVNPLSHEYLRARISIEVYGLKDALLHEARQRKLADLKILINKVNRYYTFLESDPRNLILQEVIQTECSMLVAMTGKNQPFSKMVTVNLKLIPYQWAMDYIHPFL